MGWLHASDSVNSHAPPIYVQRGGEVLPTFLSAAHVILNVLRYVLRLANPLQGFTFTMPGRHIINS